VKQGIDDPAKEVSQQNHRDMPTDSRKMMGNTKVENTKKTYLGQRVLGVKIVGGQVCNCVILGEFGEIPDSLVDILLLN
jgi:hypothetical protein